ncbi:MAG: carbon storage regulator CsrA [Planctomycetes bacterium]|nr:carbon storage regulator CsrA [Planctomycetota bacterium]
MLVLTRKKNERIRIAENIEITVVEIRGGKVRLGIECPSEIPIHREEISHRIRRAEKKLVLQ